MLPGRSHRAPRGMSLIEIMIAVAIVGILSAIAYPSYQAYVRRGARTEAKSALSAAAQNLEKCYTRFGRYDAAGCTTFNTINNGGGLISETGRYLVTFIAGSVTRDTYTLVATVQQGFPADAECGTLSLTESGARARGNLATPLNRCW
jgi:type IV pilus assembly protein PilE